MSGTFTAIDAKTNKIAWQHKTPYRIGGGGGSTVTAGGLVLRGEPDGNFLALDAKTGQELFASRPDSARTLRLSSMRWTASSSSPSRQAAIQMQGSASGDAVWTFSLKGQLGPLWPPPPPPTVAGPTGPIASGVDTIKIGANNTEYSFSPARTRIKKGTTVTFTNVGDIPHDVDRWCRKRRAAGVRARWPRAKRKRSSSISPASTTTSARRIRGCMAR